MGIRRRIGQARTWAIEQPETSWTPGAEIQDRHVIGSHSGAIGRANDIEIIERVELGEGWLQFTWCVEEDVTPTSAIFKKATHGKPQQTIGPRRAKCAIEVRPCGRGERNGSSCSTEGIRNAEFFAEVEQRGGHRRAA